MPGAASLSTFAICCRMMPHPRNWRGLMTRICRACSTANDPGAAACVTCGEELASGHPDFPAKTVQPMETSPALVRHGAMVDVLIAEPDPVVVDSEPPTYVPTFTPSLLDDARHLEGIGG